MYTRVYIRGVGVQPFWALGLDFMPRVKVQGWTVWGCRAQELWGYYGGLKNYPYYLGVPYKYTIIYPQTLLKLLRPLSYRTPL